MSDSEEQAGELSVLNVGAGDVKITFDTDDVASMERAKRMIADMQRRGYVILVEHEGKYQRMERFDPEKNVYVFADLADLEEADPETAGLAPPVGSVVYEPKRTGKRKRREIEKPVRTTRATAVARTAGG